MQHNRWPTLTEIEKRADVLAKLLLLAIYSDEHRKLKQSWKNDENYQDMQKNEKKLKSNIEPEKLKEGDTGEEEAMIKLQVRRIWEGLEERANIIAHDQFRQMNGERAVLTKKSLEKFKNLLHSETNPRLQLKMLIAYKQKKAW